MITFLEGIVFEKQPTRVVLDISGVGYEVLIPLSTSEHVPAKDKKCRLLIYDYVREDQHVLYGFRNTAERKMFTMLLSISGIGPKLALSALSGMSVRELNTAVIERDVERLNMISGVGKKTAERIVVELSDKIGEGEELDAIAADSDISGGDTRARDAVLALVSLGYKRPEAVKRVKAVLSDEPSISSAEEMIRKALAG